jgi:hypothetical protein
VNVRRDRWSTEEVSVHQFFEGKKGQFIVGVCLVFGHNLPKSLLEALSRSCVNFPAHHIQKLTTTGHITLVHQPDVDAIFLLPSSNSPLATD